jgi:hypothetical protein
VKNHLPLVDHQVAELASDANGDRDELIQLCLQVVDHDGAYRAVENQLHLAAKIRRKKSYTWPAAFRAAHLRLLRGYLCNLFDGQCERTGCNTYYSDCRVVFKPGIFCS